MAKRNGGLVCRGDLTWPAIIVSAAAERSWKRQPLESRVIVPWRRPSANGGSGEALRSGPRELCPTAYGHAGASGAELAPFRRCLLSPVLATHLLHREGRTSVAESRLRARAPESSESPF